MATKTKSKANGQTVPVIESVAFESLVPDPGNPRIASTEQIDAICASIVEFGIVDPLIARAEDSMIIGGHQRHEALRRLLAGEYRGRDKKPVVFSLPNGEVPVVRIAGLDKRRTKILNLALNRISGEWDHDRLAHIFKEFYVDEASLDSLTISGFTNAEIVDYVDLSAELDARAPELTIDDGQVPQFSQKAPKLDLDFSSKELRDAVKATIGASTQPDEPSGDVLARMLGVKAKAKKKPSFGTKQTRATS